MPYNLQIRSIEFDEQKRSYILEGKSGLERCSIINFKPIPITPEFLERLGFEKKEFHLIGYIKEQQDYVLNIYPDYDFVFRYETFKYRSDTESEWKEEKSRACYITEWYLGCTHGNIPCVTLNYIHELQNLIFALSGVEPPFKKVKNNKIKQ